MQKGGRGESVPGKWWQAYVRSHRGRQQVGGTERVERHKKWLYQYHVRLLFGSLCLHAAQAGRYEGAAACFHRGLPAAACALSLFTESTIYATPPFPQERVCPPLRSTLYIISMPAFCPLVLFIMVFHVDIYLLFNRSPNGAPSFLY